MLDKLLSVPFQPDKWPLAQPAAQQELVVQQLMAFDNNLTEPLIKASDTFLFRNLSVYLVTNYGNHVKISHSE